MSRETETIILKAMAKDKAHRYTTAGSLGADVRRLLAGEPIEAKRDSAIYFVGKTLRKHFVAAATTVAFLVMLVVATIVGWTLYLRADRARLAANVAAAMFQQQRDAAEALRERNQRQLYFAKMNLAGQVTSERFGIDTVRAALESWLPDASSGGSDSQGDLRGWEWYYLYGLAHREEFQSAPLNGWAWEADYNPDCTEFVVGINGWGLQVRDARMGQVLRERFSGSLRSIDWSADGSVIGIGNMRDEVELLDAQSLRSIWKKKVELGGRIAPVRLSPDGKWLAVSSKVASYAMTVLMLDATDGSLIKRIPHRGLVHDLQWSPDASLVAVLTRNGSVSLWNVPSGKLLRELRPEPNSNADGGYPLLAWSTDGTRLAAGTPLRIWNVNSWQESQPDIPNGATSIAWHPEGSSLACGYEDGRIRVIEPTGDEVHNLCGHTNAVASIRWSSDGEQLLSCGVKDLTVQTWRIASSDRSQLLDMKDTPVGVKGVAWSPDGKFLAATEHYENSINVWDIQRRQLVFSYKAPDNQRDQLAFSPDGIFIAFHGLGKFKRWRSDFAIAIHDRGMMAIARSIDSNANRYSFIQCRLHDSKPPAYAMKNVPPRDSSATPFDVGKPCDQRSSRKMYQFLTSKVGGLNLTQAVNAADPEVHSSSRRHDVNHSAMNDHAWGCL